MRPDQDAVRVLFTAGNGRSGSTILNVILGQVPGFFAGGELLRVWERGVIDNRPCGCGVAFRECATWQAIFAEAFGGFERIDATKMVALRDRYVLTKRIPGLMLRRSRGPRPSRDLEEYLAATGQLYHAIRKVSGCEVIADASKWPAYGYLLGRLPGIELSVIHLVRDPRATAHSWTRVKEFEPGQYLPRQSPLRTTAYWLVWNPAIEYFWKRPGQKYIALRYEQLVLEPGRRLEEVVRFAGGDPGLLPLSGPNTVRLRPTHSVAGNAERLATGDVPLRVDEKWKSDFGGYQRAVVTALTWPWLIKYGYWHL